MLNRNKQILYTTDNRNKLTKMNIWKNNFSKNNSTTKNSQETQNSCNNLYSNKLKKRIVLKKNFLNNLKS